MSQISIGHIAKSSEVIAGERVDQKKVPARTLDSPLGEDQATRADTFEMSCEHMGMAERARPQGEGRTRSKIACFVTYNLHSPFLAGL